MKSFHRKPVARHATGVFLLLAAASVAALSGRHTLANVPRPAVGENRKLPLGTVLPVSLEHELSTKGHAKDEAIEGRLMQDVPLPGGGHIPAGSKLRGSITDSSPAGQGQASITVRFTRLETRDATIPVFVGLRAMAPFLDVERAKTSYQESAGSPGGWGITVQVGGDLRYGDGAKVTNAHHRVVGKATKNNGVLGRLEDSPGSPCEGWPDATSGSQALWVFSVDACGVYDLKGMRIARAGNKEPLGEITLAKEEGDIKIMKSSALLLRVVK